MSEKLPQSADAPITDGRRQRGEDNRARIVKAMLDLVQSGEYAPSAEQVAARADVSLRTVFRHFEDMDRLYREMSGVIETEVRAVALRPFDSSDWREQVVEMVGRRAGAYEKITHIRHAAEVHRHRSKFLESDTQRFVGALREILGLIAPASVRDTDQFETLDLLLSFETWSRLRREQKLSPKRARAVLEASVRRVVASL
jgi:AcrR family transcriptional regulator